MGIAPLPTPLERLGNRGFAFQPAIVRAGCNEWFFRAATWPEMLVVNAESGREIWIPRRFVGEISSVEENVPVVLLLKELEYRDNAIWPHRPRVIQMPVREAASRTDEQRKGAARVIPISLQSAGGTARMVVGAAVIGALAVAGWIAGSQAHARRTADLIPVGQRIR